MENKENLIGGEALAYLGDAVLELEVRRYLVAAGGRRASEESLKFVTAKAQCEAFSKIENMLRDDEISVFHRARNNHKTQNVPKSATPAQYRRSTGFEAIFGYLYLRGEKERITQLFEAAYYELLNN